MQHSQHSQQPAHNFKLNNYEQKNTNLNFSPIQKKSTPNLSQRRSKSNVANIFLENDNSKKLEKKQNNFVLNFPQSLVQTAELCSQHFSSRGPSPFRPADFIENKPLTQRGNVGGGQSILKLKRDKFQYK